jgi:hypothetical protein
MKLQLLPCAVGSPNPTAPKTNLLSMKKPGTTKSEY